MISDIVDLVEMLKTRKEDIRKVFETTSDNYRKCQEKLKEFETELNQLKGMYSEVEKTLSEISLDDPSSDDEVDVTEQEGDLPDPINYTEGAVINFNDYEYLLVRNDDGSKRWEVQVNE